MLRQTMRTTLALAALAVIAACSRVSAEQAAKLAADSARAEGANAAEVTRRAERARGAVAARDASASSRAATLASGYSLQLTSVTDVTSQKDHAGKPFTARVVVAALGTKGDTVIPVGAEFIGQVSELQDAGTPGATGRLMVAFNSVRIDGHDYPVDTRVLSLATRSVSRGVTADDAAKVGVGAVIGGVAGRVIGGNATGTAVGAVAGGAAGAVYANRSKDHDIVLTPGSNIEIELTSAFSRR